jgi:hypothetical protein
MANGRQTYNVGGMLASAGQNIGQSIGGGISGISTGLSGMLTRRAEKQREQNAQEQFQQILGAYQNNPAELRKQGLQAKASGDKNLQRIGEMLLAEANRAQEVLDKKAARTTESVEKARGRYDALKAARADTDTAFDDAVNLRRILTEAKTRAESEGATDKEKKLFELLKTRAITPSEYAKELLEEQGVSVAYKQLVDEDGIEKEFKIINNAVTGEEIDRVALGPVAQTGSGKDPFSTAHGMEALETARTNASDAAEEAGQLSRAAAFVEDRAFYERGLPGRALAASKEFAGIGDEVNYFQAQLREIRMSGVLGMLPPGVASDRDVALALDTQVDFNNLDNEEAASFLRGMAKIQKAKEEYHRQKISWMTKTRDPNALGFDFWVQKKDAERQMDELKTGEAFARFQQALARAESMEKGPTKEEEMKALYQIFPDEMAVYDNLIDARTDWETVQNKPTGFN